MGGGGRASAAWKRRSMRKMEALQSEFQREAAAQPSDRLDKRILKEN